MAKKTHPLRPSGDWDKEKVAPIVLERLCEMPLTQALKLGIEDETGRHWGLPSMTTFNEWMADRPDWAAARAHARKIYAEKLAMESLQLVDEEPERKANGTIDNASVRRAEARARQRQWLAGKLDRQTYGDQVQVDMNVHGNIDISSILAEARGRVIEGSATRESDDASDLFD